MRLVFSASVPRIPGCPSGLVLTGGCLLVQLDFPELKNAKSVPVSPYRPQYQIGFELIWQIIFSCLSSGLQGSENRSSQYIDRRHLHQFEVHYTQSTWVSQRKPQTYSSGITAFCNLRLFMWFAKASRAHFLPSDFDNSISLIVGGVNTVSRRSISFAVLALSRKTKYFSRVLAAKVKVAFINWQVYNF